MSKPDLSTYGGRLRDLGYAGQIVDTNPATIESKTNEAATAIDYGIAVALVGVLMVAYVMFGGMLATTWVQIIKAVLLLSGASFMAIMVMTHYGFSMEAMFKHATEVHSKGIIFGAIPLKYKTSATMISGVRKINAPIVGVPCFLRCDCGPL